ncbi:hypothetical protein FACS1894188_03650 [Clostridia bacterium]|nr:hypothetical protein FACS1894188_03650 [Clostridia bacterium]
MDNTDGTTLILSMNEIIKVSPWLPFLLRLNEKDYYRLLGMAEMATTKMSETVKPSA